MLDGAFSYGRSMRYRRIAATVAAGGLALGGTMAAAAAPKPQSITWHDCRTGPDDALGAALATAGAQCGELTVPVDYTHPHGRATTVAMARIKATDPAHRRGVLMLNPGGPGTSGMELLLAGVRMPAVAARYDLVGMDPRFVGRSDPIECRWPTDTFLRSAGPDRRRFTESVALARQLAAGCAQADLPYASTRNTARDMDRVRVALREPKISYLGYSYGTYLAAVYLQMFGAHADRIVLDSAVDPAVYGPGLFSRSAPAIQAALEHWAAWAAARDGDYHLGATADAVLARVTGINRAAARSPLTVGGYAVDAHVLPYFLFAHLYDDNAGSYADLAAQLRVFDAAARGEPATPTPALEAFLTGLFTGAGAATDRAGTPVLCADRAVSRDPESYFRDIQAHRGDEPLFGPMTRNITPCAFWPARPVEAPTTIGNDVPALIVGADGDPAVPYPGQLAMHRALAKSRMLTLRGRFGHGQYLVAGNACVDDTVNRYLVGGALPAHDTGCAVGS